MCLKRTYNAVLLLMGLKKERKNREESLFNAIRNVCQAKQLPCCQNQIELRFPNYFPVAIVSPGTKVTPLARTTVRLLESPSFSTTLEEVSKQRFKARNSYPQQRSNVSHLFLSSPNLFLDPRLLCVCLCVCEQYGRIRTTKVFQ